MKKAVFIFGTLFLLVQCTVIHPGQVALDIHYGKVKRILTPGPHHVGIGKKVIRFDATIQNYSDKLKFPTKEGIEVTSEITLLYHFIPDSIKSIYLKFGKNYFNTLIVNNLISVIRQTGLNYKASELIIERANLEKTIHEKMDVIIRKYGFDIDLILLKDIDLPPDIVATIQAKLNAEQQAKKTEIDNEVKRKQLEFELEKQKKETEMEITKQRLTMEFSIEKQKKESERLLIESEGVKKSQDILNSSLNDKLIKFKALEITKALITSPNTKVIITDGKSSVMYNDK